jgi:triacylglycerol lipase
MRIKASLFLIAIAASACAPASEEGDPAVEQEGKGDTSADLCWLLGKYGDGTCDRSCLQHDSDCDAPEALQADPGCSVTSNPIVLQAGVGSGENLWYFRGVAEALRACGNTVYLGTDTFEDAGGRFQMPAYQSTETRATFLARIVELALKQTGKQKVNLIGHSMGGLDSRTLADLPSMRGKVASITTISTPHKGSAIADTLLYALDHAWAAPIVFVLKNIYGRVATNGWKTDEDLLAGLRSCSERRAVDYNREHRAGEVLPFENGIFFQSWAGISHRDGEEFTSAELAACGGIGQIHYLARGIGLHEMSSILVGAVPFVNHSFYERLPNAAEWLPNPRRLEGTDGFVAVAHAKWGRFNGCIPADHVDELGKLDNQSMNPRTGFDHLRFYKSVVRDLAADGY